MCRFGCFRTCIAADISHEIAKDLALAPLLKSAMHRFVVGTALRQQVPLPTRVQNPEHRFQDVACWHRFAPWSAFRNVFLGNCSRIRRAVAKCGRIIGTFSPAFSATGKKPFLYTTFGRLAAIGKRTGVANILGVNISGFSIVPDVVAVALIVC
jgi:hypothetical protein